MQEESQKKSLLFFSFHIDKITIKFSIVNGIFLFNENYVISIIKLYKQTHLGILIALIVFVFLVTNC
jgi:hypothetical protein